MPDSILMKRKFIIILIPYFRNIWIHLIFIPILVSGIMGISLMTRVGLTVFEFGTFKLIPFLPKISLCNPQDCQLNENAYSMHTVTWVWGTCGVVYLMAHPLLGVITYSLGLIIFKFNLILIDLDKNENLFGGNLF
jgi:hypothetical protein